MTKIGVGVGEEFPIDDKPENGGAEGAHGRDEARADDGCCGWDEDYEDWRARRYGWRARRHEWRARRREWRRRYSEEMRAKYGPNDPLYYYWGLPGFVRVIIWIAAAVLALRIVAHAPLIVLALALLAVLYVVHRHREDARHDMPPPPQGH